MDNQSIFNSVSFTGDFIDVQVANIGTLNTSLTPLQTVTTDANSNLATIAYTQNNTPLTIMFRDSSGNTICNTLTCNYLVVNNNVVFDGLRVTPNSDNTSVFSVTNAANTLVFINVDSTNKIVTIANATTNINGICNISNVLSLPYYTSNGFLKTNSSNGTISIDTNIYLTTTSAASTYLTISNAASTYQTISGMSSYLTTSNAASTYLTISNAASTYQTISGMSSYLTTSNAASTYQTISGMSSYLTTSSASSTYLTISNAASTYQTISGMSSYLTTASAASSYLPLTGGTLTGPLTISEYSTSSVTTLILDNTGSGNNVFQMEAGPTTAIITLNGSSPYNFNFGGSGAFANYVFSEPLSCTSSFSATSTITTGLTASSLVQTNSSKQLTASNTLPSGCSATNMTLTTPTISGNLTTNSIVPTASATYNIGTSSNVYSTIYSTNNCSTFYYDSSLTYYLNYVSGVGWESNTNLSPQTNGSFSLGTSSYKWGNIYANAGNYYGTINTSGSITQTGATSISTGTNGITCNGALSSSGQITSSNNTMIASNWSDGINTRGFSILWVSNSSSYAISFKSGSYGPNAYIFDNPINGTSLSLTNTLSTTGNITQTGSTGITSGSGGIVCNGVMSNYGTQTFKASSGWTNSYLTRGSTYTSVGNGSSTVTIASWAINTTNGVTFRIKASINGSGNFQNGYDFVCPESTFFGRYYGGLVTLSAPTITYYNSNPSITWGTSGSNVVLNFPQNYAQGTYVQVYWEIQLIYPSLS